MNKLFLITLAIVSCQTFAAELIGGASTVVIQEKYSWIKIQGDSAKMLYDTLAVPAKNDQGEAGADLYFKSGKSYRCVNDKQLNEYACDIMIKNPKTGQIN